MLKIYIFTVTTPLSTHNIGFQLWLGKKTDTLGENKLLTDLGLTTLCLIQTLSDASAADNFFENIVTYTEIAHEQFLIHIMATSSPTWLSHTSTAHKSLSKQLAPLPHRLLAQW